MALRGVESRLLTTINRQESLLVNTRIFTIESIVIVECWGLLTTSYEPVNCQSAIQVIVETFKGPNVPIAAVDELKWCLPMKNEQFLVSRAISELFIAISSALLQVNLRESAGNTPRKQAS